MENSTIIKKRWFGILEITYVARAEKPVQRRLHQKSLRQRW